MCVFHSLSLFLFLLICSTFSSNCHFSSYSHLLLLGLKCQSHKYRSSACVCVWVKCLVSILFPLRHVEMWQMCPVFISRWYWCKKMPLLACGFALVHGLSNYISFYFYILSHLLLKSGGKMFCAKKGQLEKLERAIYKCGWINKHTATFQNKKLGWATSSVYIWF